jgi:dolichyl-phosphate-mannose-protein mannosyltransferase
MNDWKTHLPSPSMLWFKFVMVGIFLLSLILHFWNLSQFNELVFDEVYYAKFANNYLTGKPFFNVHPPLGQYLIAIGIWIGSHFPAAPDTVNQLTGSVRSTFSYRWLNALTGSFLPLLIGAIAYQLTHRRSYAAIAALFATVDGLFLVESRYALNDIYIVFFGLLGQWFFLLSLEDRIGRPGLKLLWAGIFLGASISVKWNGLGFLCGIYLILAIAWISFLFRKTPWASHPIFGFFPSLSIPLQKITRINLPQIVGYLGIIPIIVYVLLWIPHLRMNPQYGFWAIHQKIVAFHESLGSNVHPYCAPWYSWLVMGRPIALRYETGSSLQGKQVIYDVHAMGNPLLLWLSTIAIFLLILLAVKNQFFTRERRQYLRPKQAWVTLYLICNYIANLLPWIKVNRCVFFYHYMEAYAFAILALAWIVDGLLKDRLSICRITGLIMIILIVAAFIFWLPIYLGLPLSPEGFRIRMLFPGWI